MITIQQCADRGFHLLRVTHTGACRVCDDLDDGEREAVFGPREDRNELWFYVPDYPKVQHYLHALMECHTVYEHAAEPGRVGNREDDADVIVQGLEKNIQAFRVALTRAEIEGLMIEGTPV